MRISWVKAVAVVFKKHVFSPVFMLTPYRSTVFVDEISLNKEDDIILHTLGSGIVSWMTFRGAAIILEL